MRKTHFSLIGFCISIFLFLTCKKEESFSDIPEIALVSVSPISVIEFQDTIIFNLTYTDGNGDLGENTASAENVFIKDARLSTEYAFRIPQLAPDNSSVAIQGSISVKLPPTGITNGGSSQNTTFEIYVKDRAGNKSNVVQSPTITIQ